MAESLHDSLHDKMIKRVDKDGSTTFFPEGSVDVKSITGDVKARMAVGFVGGGSLACAGINCAVNTLNAIINCGQERLIASMFGFYLTVPDCAQMIPGYLRALTK